MSTRRPVSGCTAWNGCSRTLAPIFVKCSATILRWRVLASVPAIRGPISQIFFRYP